MIPIFFWVSILSHKEHSFHYYFSTLVRILTLNILHILSGCIVFYLFFEIENSAEITNVSAL